MIARRIIFGMVGCTILLAGVAHGQPRPSETSSAWELSLVPSPLMKIVMDSGSGPTTYWYMVYTVTNNTGQDVDFNPEIVRVSEIENETPADKASASPDSAPKIMVEAAIVGVDSRLYKAIADRHAKTYPFLVTPVKAIDRLLQGKDNARTSVAVFPDLDPRVSKFTIFMGGLSGERVTRNNPKYDPRRPADDKGNPKIFVLQKTLSLPFTMPGDLRTRGAAVPAPGKQTWVMR